jgi:hypothetical protein
MPIKVAAGEHKHPPVVLPVIPLSEKPTRTVREFCARNNISVGLFYKLRADGKAPRMFYVGAKPLITVAAEQEWLRERESEAVGEVRVSVKALAEATQEST